MRRSRVSQLTHLSLTFYAVTRMLFILHSFCNMVRFFNYSRSLLFAYIKSYDKSPFNSSPFNSTMTNTWALFCVVTFTSGETFNSAECYTAFTTFKNSNHITANNGVLTVSRLSRTMPDTPLLAVTEPEPLTSICQLLFMDEDESRANTTFDNCYEQLFPDGEGQFPNKSRSKVEEEMSWITRCMFVEFEVVNNETDAVNKQRLTELVDKSSTAFRAASEKAEFLKRVVATCGFWDCLKGPCREFDVKPVVSSSA